MSLPKSNQIKSDQIKWKKTRKATERGAVGFRYPGLAYIECRSACGTRIPKECCRPTNAATAAAEMAEDRWFYHFLLLLLLQPVRRLSFAACLAGYFIHSFMAVSIQPLFIFLLKLSCVCQQLASLFSGVLFWD